MQVLIAPDSFTGTLDADSAATALAAGWRDLRPGDGVHRQPMSDGGPGFVAAIAGGLGVQPTVVGATGPHGEPVSAQLLLVDTARGPVAYLEAAQVCGLALAPEPRRAVDATSAGLVPVLSAALAAGASEVVVGVGGTACTDGGRPIVDVFAGAWPVGVRLVAATDVANPLLGPAGAARSFGPQKGAADAEVVALEHRLEAWAASGDVDPGTPGAGAGGGLGYGLLRLGATRVPGVEVVAGAVGLAGQARAADLVVTGEGRLDFGTLLGKVVAGVAQVAQAERRPCVAVVGSSAVGRREVAAAGVDEVYSLIERVGRNTALTRPDLAIRTVAGLVAREWGRT